MGLWRRNGLANSDGQSNAVRRAALSNCDSARRECGLVMWTNVMWSEIFSPAVLAIWAVFIGTFIVSLPIFTAILLSSDRHTPSDED